MEKKKISFYKKHKKTFSKSLIFGLIMTLICYGLGILFVDILKLHFYIAGLIITPISFLTRYVINKNLVFKND